MTNLRPIRFKEWVSKGKWPSSDGKSVLSAGEMSTEFTGIGYFHQWINTADKGVHALIETLNGEIILIPYYQVKFISLPQNLFDYPLTPDEMIKPDES